MGFQKVRPRPRQQAPTAEAVRAAREKSGLTQTGAASLVYVGVRTWQKWEAGDTTMSGAVFELFKLKSGNYMKLADQEKDFVNRYGVQMRDVSRAQAIELYESTTSDFIRGLCWACYSWHLADQTGGSDAPDERKRAGVMNQEWIKRSDKVPEQEGYDLPFYSQTGLVELLRFDDNFLRGYAANTLIRASRLHKPVTD